MGSLCRGADTWRRPPTVLDVTSPAPARNAPRWLTVLLALIGVVCIVVSVFYFTETAANLPSFFPGHQAGSAHHHTKHGIAALVVGLLALVGAWITSGTKHAD
jgi:amino acid permease